MPRANSNGSSSSSSSSSKKVARESQSPRAVNGGGSDAEESSGDLATASSSQVDSSAPVVLQCGQCRAIVGDTCAFVASSEEMNTITLSGVSANVHLLDELITSRDGKDRGSTYNPIVCRVCENVLGRMYCTTPRHLDNIRDMFTLSIPTITSYVLGSGGASSPEALLASGTSLQEQITRLQRILLIVHERLERLEEHEFGGKQ